MNKLIQSLIAVFLLIFTLGSFNHANAAGFADKFLLTWTTDFSSTPHQIGAGFWRNSEGNFTGAASCLDPAAKYSNGAITINLIETCGAIGGGISEGNGKMSLPITFGLGWQQGPLQLHVGAGPDLNGTPVRFVSFTYPF